MQQTNPADCLLVRVLIVLLVSLGTALSARPSADKNRKNAAKGLAREIEGAQFPKVYVADFVDSAGVRSARGCY